MAQDATRLAGETFIGCVDVLLVSIADVSLPMALLAVSKSAANCRAIAADKPVSPRQCDRLKRCPDLLPSHGTSSAVSS
jgi:hypothetical protein